jgi:GNAT superfamily N-acetyltransferase
VRRPRVDVRRITGADVATVAPLWADFVAQEGSESLLGADNGVLRRVGQALLDSEMRTAEGRPPAYRLVIAAVDGQDVGFASLTVADRGLLGDSGAVVVDVVHVTGDHRKRGIGTVLLREAVVLADEVQASDVVVSTPTRGRDVNRFYARLGLSPTVVRRSAPVASLRRKLGVEPRLDATAELTPVQRSVRRRALLSPRRPVPRP